MPTGGTQWELRISASTVDLGLDKDNTTGVSLGVLHQASRSAGEGEAGGQSL